MKKRISKVKEHYYYIYLYLYLFTYIQELYIIIFRQEAEQNFIQILN